MNALPSPQGEGLEVGGGALLGLGPLVHLRSGEANEQPLSSGKTDIAEHVEGRVKQTG